MDPQVFTNFVMLSLGASQRQDKGNKLGGVLGCGMFGTVICLLFGNHRVLATCLFVVIVIKGCWHLGQSSGTFGENDGGCRECTTFSNVMVSNGNSNKSLRL